MQLSIIIPTYNGCDLLQRMLPTLYVALQNISEYEIIIVDNASTDNTKQFIADHYTDIIYTYLPQNGGFTKACNDGAKQARGEFLLFLNNDCFVHEDTIDHLLTFLKNNPKYCATQPVIYNPLKEIEQIGYIIDLYIAKARVIKNANEWSSFSVEVPEIFTKQFHYGISGTCLLIKKDTFVQVGMFDETFHSYLEDIDLCLSLTKSGYAYAPCIEASCTHNHMATSSKMGLYKEKHDFLNWIRIIVKHYPLVFVMHHFFSLLLERLRNLNGILKKTVRIYL